MCMCLSYLLTFLMSLTYKHSLINLSTVFDFNDNWKRLNIINGESTKINETYPF